MWGGGGGGGGEALKLNYIRYEKGCEEKKGPSFVNCSREREVKVRKVLGFRNAIIFWFEKEHGMGLKELGWFI